MKPERETCGSIALMLAGTVAIVIVAAGDAAWQRVKRLWK